MVAQDFGWLGTAVKGKDRLLSSIENSKKGLLLSFVEEDIPVITHHCAMRELCFLSCEEWITSTFRFLSYQGR